MPTKTPAAILIEKDKPMVIDDIELPDLGPSHVLVKQFATGVCHSQLHELDRPQPTVPLVLGHESTGVVVATGKDVTHVKEGDHVMVTWVQRNPVNGPRPVPAKVSYKGEEVKYGAPANVGTFTWAESIVVDEQMVVPLDKDADVDATAPVGCAVMTGVGAAINAAMVRPGESVAVIGVGGVGLSVVAGCGDRRRLPHRRGRPVGREDRVRQAVRRHARRQRAQRRPGRADPRDVRRRLYGRRRPRLRRHRPQDHDGAEPDDGARPPSR